MIQGPAAVLNSIAAGLDRLRLGRIVCRCRRATRLRNRELQIASKSQNLEKFSLSQYSAQRRHHTKSPTCHGMGGRGREGGARREGRGGEVAAAAERSWGQANLTGRGLRPSLLRHRGAQH